MTISIRALPSQQPVESTIPPDRINSVLMSQCLPEILSATNPAKTKIEARERRVLLGNCEPCHLSKGEYRLLLTQSTNPTLYYA
jgi:hypothetical protein